jgi:adenosyl cobinamide kinase/adenosyl cobinamide phosphate guanylyltransferase
LKPPAGVTLLLGGARCGKSDLAVRLAGDWGGPVTVLVTAEPDGDADLVARIERHQRERPAAWTTVEAPRALADAVRAVDPDHLVLVDCITIWVSNLMAPSPTDRSLDEDCANDVADELLDALADRRAPSILVTNEVGMGVHPSTTLGREYRDVLGRVNRRLCEASSTALLVVAGRVVPLLPPGSVLR